MCIQPFISLMFLFLKIGFELLLVNHLQSPCPLFSFFKISFIFRERGSEGRKEGEKHQVGEKHQLRETSIGCPPTGDLARNPGMCPDWN